MPPTVRTETQLLALFPDNDIGEISEGDGRDLIASSFGFVFNRPPGPRDDALGTSGVGATFDTGSRWFDSIARRWWKCLSGLPTLANWQVMMFDGQAAGGRLRGTYPNPTLAPSGVLPGVYGDATHFAVFAVDVDGTVTAAGVFPVPAFSIPVPLILTAPSDITTDLILRQKSATQTAPLLLVQDNSGSLLGPSISAKGEFTDPGPATSTAAQCERFGNGALRANVAGNLCTAFGNSSLAYNLDGVANTAVGQGALERNDHGQFNTAVGRSAGNANLGGVYNTMVGNNAGRDNDAASHNTAIGHNSLARNKAAGNTAVGSGASASSNAAGNTAVGKQALYNATTGQNAGLGSSVGVTIVTGTRCTLVGNNADVLGASDSDEIVIGHGVVGNGTHTITLGTANDDVHFAGAVVHHVEAPHTAFMGPVSGGAAPALFRGLDATDIPSLDASKITTGTFGVGVIPGLDASKITSGVFGTALIPGLDASKTVSGVFNLARIPLIPATYIVGPGTLPVGILPTIPPTLIGGPGTLPIGVLPTIPPTLIGGPGTLPPSVLPAIPPANLPPGVSQWVGPYDLDYTDLNQAGATSYKLTINFAAGQTVTGAKCQVTQTWAASVGGIGLDGVAWPAASMSGSEVGMVRPWPLTAGTLNVFDGAGASLPMCRNQSGGWSAGWRSTSGAGDNANLTAGHLKIWYQVATVV